MCLMMIEMGHCHDGGTHTQAVNKRHGLLMWRVAVNILNMCQGIVDQLGSWVGA